MHFIGSSGPRLPPMHMQPVGAVSPMSGLLDRGALSGYLSTGPPSFLALTSRIPHCVPRITKEVPGRCMHPIRVASFLCIGVPNRCNFDMMARDGRLVWPLALLSIRTLRYFGSPAGAPLLGTRVSGNGAYMRPITRCLYSMCN